MRYCNALFTREKKKPGQLRLLPPQCHGCLTSKKSPPPGNGRVITPHFKATGIIHKPCSHANLTYIMLKPSNDFTSNSSSKTGVALVPREVPHWPQRASRGMFQRSCCPSSFLQFGQHI